jgi:hypothetical protein
MKTFLIKGRGGKVERGLLAHYSLALLSCDLLPSLLFGAKHQHLTKKDRENSSQK